MFERFTDKGRKIIILAREEAERHQNDYLGTEHLVLAILRESDGIALMSIKKMGLSSEQVRLEIERNLPGGGTTMTFGEIPFRPRVKKVIMVSRQKSWSCRHPGDHDFWRDTIQTSGEEGHRIRGGRGPSSPEG